MKRMAAVLLISAALTAPVFADEISSAPAAASEVASPASSVVINKGFYTTVDLGVVNYTSATSAYLTNDSLPNPNTAGIGGGYHFNRYLAAEAAYSSIGNSVLSATSSPVFTESLKAYVLQIDAVATYSLLRNLDVFGKLGANYTKLDYSFTGTSTSLVSGSGSGSKVNLMFGLGAQYNFNLKYAIRAQYEDFGKTQVVENFNNGSAATNNIGVRIITVGGVYNF